MSKDQKTQNKAEFQSKEQSALTLTQKRHCEELAKRGSKYKVIAEKFEKNQLDRSLITELHYYVVENPGSYAGEKYKTHFDYYLTGLAKGKLPKKCKDSLRILRALKHKNSDGSESKERKAAVLFLKKLGQNTTSKINTSEYQNILERLDAVENFKELKIEQPKSDTKVIEETQVAANILANRAAVNTDIEKQAAVVHRNWKIEAVPAELVEKFRPLDTRLAEIVFEDRELNSTKVKLQGELDTAKDSQERQRLQKEIQKLNHQQESMKKEFMEIQEQLEPLRSEQLDHFKRQAHILGKIEQFSSMAGMDMQKVYRLITAYRANAKLSTKAIKDQQGKEIFKGGIITIQGFEHRPQIDNQYPVPIDDPEMGVLMVNFQDEEGNDMRTPLNEFINDYINGLEAYDADLGLEEFNERRRYELGYKPLEKGQYFASEDEGFQITGLLAEVKDDGTKEWYVHVDPSVITTPAAALSPSLDRRAQASRTSNRLPIGQFEKLLVQRGFRRVSDVGELQHLADQIAQDRCNQYNNAEPILASSEASRARAKQARGTMDYQRERATLPTAVGQSTEMLYYHQPTGREVPATLTLVETPEGKTVHRLRYFPGKTPDANTHTNYDPTRAPAGFIAAHKTKPTRTGGGRPTGPNGNKRPLHLKPVDEPITPYWEERDLDNDLLLQAMNKGQLRDAAIDEDADQIPDATAATSAGSTTLDDPLSDDVDMNELYEKMKSQDASGDGEPAVSNMALPYDVIHKVGGMSVQQRGALSELWTNSRFLSVSDVWEMAKAMWEYYDRHFERRQKARYSDVGQDIPYFAPEMQRINQSAENEFVSQYKESFDDAGVLDMLERMRKTYSQDEMKAAFETLCEKGQMRWDDVSIWENINRFAHKDFRIPIPSNRDPATVVSDEDERTGYDFLKGAIDSIWGDGTYNDWYSKNKSTFASNAKGNYETGKELENKEGGPQKKLAELLRRHKMGEFVDPHEYEGLILFMVEYGKGGMHDKIYYMVEGVAARNADGRTILPYDRMAHINSEVMVRFPLLQYMCDSMNREGGSHKPTIDDYEYWANIFDRGDVGNPENCYPTAAVDDFLWEEALSSRSTRQRINKAFRDGERIDHDDMYGYVPPATVQVVNDACKALSGSKKFVTIEGYANVFPGFSKYFETLVKTGNTKRMQQAVKSYVRFESIMTDRWKKGDESYQRLDADILRRKPVASDTPPIEFINEGNDIVRSIAEAYQDPKLLEIVQTMQTETGDLKDPIERKKQDKVENALKIFDKHFDRVVTSDNGARMLAVIAGKNLISMQYTSHEEKMRKKLARGGSDE